MKPAALHRPGRGLRGFAQRACLSAALALCPLASQAQAAAPPQPPTSAQPQPKILRYAFPVAESSFDPTQISDLYSRTLTPHIFEGLYHYDHLARPLKFKPLTATALPEVSDNFRRWTIKLRPGIRFADDPAFHGRPRELVAEDYVYAFKRFADPVLKSPSWGDVEALGLLGLEAVRSRAAERKQPFDYDTPVEGLRALDRYTLQLTLAAPRPRLLEFLASSDLFGAVAREVVEAYPGKLDEHPVGTGPFKLAQWRRGSLIVLERNPGYRERFYDAEPAAGDAEAQAIAARLAGRRLPMIDRVEISIIGEQQPRWLSFLNGQQDMIEEVPPDFIAQATPNNVLAPRLARQGVQALRSLRPDVVMSFFNMEHPLVGGYTADKVALRRAISLGIDVEREIRLFRRGQAIPAQAPSLPYTSSYDPAFKSEMSAYDPARAKALLDLYGYTDRDGDGWRDQPDGSPLVLEMSIQTDQSARQQAELWQRNMNALKLRVRFKAAQWPEQLKAAQAGTLMMWSVGGVASVPDGLELLQRYNGALIGTQNLARFQRPEFDALYGRLAALPDGPERAALFREAKRLAVAYMPYRAHVHRYATDLVHAQLIGYRRTVFWQEWWHYVDIDERLRVVGR